MADPANPPRPPASLWRVSLREVLLLVSFLAVGCVALKYPNEWWWVALSSCTLLVFLTALVAVLVDRGSRQAMAIGCAVCMATYGVLVWSSADREFDPYSGRLPTTQIMKPLFQAIVAVTYHDMNTGKLLADYDPSSAPTNAPLNVYSLESPDRGQFMLISHLLWALLLAWFGARVACALYARRIREQQAT